MADLPALLHGTRIDLRPFRDADVDALYALYSDPRVTRYWSFPAWTRPAQALDYLELRRTLVPPAVHCWAIADAADTLIGTLSLFLLHGETRRGEIGYALSPARQGQGLAGEALRLALDHAFTTLDLERVEADIDPRNVPSWRLLEGLGFRREALLHDRCRSGNEVGDAAIYGLGRADWRAATGA